VVSEIRKELKEQQLKPDEEKFAKLILESMECKDGKCVAEGAKKIAEESRKQSNDSDLTVEQAIKEKIIEKGSKVVFKSGEYKDKEGIVDKIEEGTAVITVNTDTSDPVSIEITGDSTVTVNTDTGTVTVCPEVPSEEEQVDIEVTEEPEVAEPEFEETVPEETAEEEASAEEEFEEEEPGPETPEEEEFEEEMGESKSNQDDASEQQASKVDSGSGDANECCICLEAKDDLDDNGMCGECRKLCEEDDLDENWKGAPKGWTRKSIEKFARSLTRKTKGDSKGFVRACVRKMTGKVDDPEAFCAGLKDEFLGKTTWRGKESVDTGVETTAESEVEERIVKRKDGWYVKSRKGRNLGGPYSTKKEAEKRLKEVEKFKHMKKESISDLVKDIRNLKIQEAGTRAELDKALELLEEAEKQIKSVDESRRKQAAFEAKILVGKLKGLRSRYESVLSSFRSKLEEKVTTLRQLRDRVKKLEEELQKSEKNVKSLKESNCCDHKGVC